MYRCAQLYVYFMEINNEQKEKQLERSSGLLKYKPEAVPTLNSCMHMMRKNAISCLRTIRKNKDDLTNTTYKYKTQYRVNSSDIHNGVGDQYHIAMTGMVP